MCLALFPTSQATASTGPWCTLKIGDVAPRNGAVSVSYTCRPRNPTDVKWQVSVWGQDLIDGDDRVYYQCLHPYEGRIWVSEYHLNEDIGDRDEIYVRVTFKKTDGKFYSVLSNTVTGWWGDSFGFGPPPPPCSRKVPA